MKGGKSQKHSACKYASSHLVRVICLQNRRPARVRVQEKKGHPLVCHVLGSECKSPLRILRTAVVHFPLLGEFQRQVYTCLAQLKVIRDIDLGIQNKDYQLLLQACGVTFTIHFVGFTQSIHNSHAHRMVTCFCN